MGQLSESLPDGGETIYEICRARDWLRAKVYFITKGMLNISLADEQEEDPERFNELFEDRIKRDYNFLESEYFWEGVPGRLMMAYGVWVERELRIAIANRLSMAKSHPVWMNFDLNDHVRLACFIIFKTCIRCAAIRGYAYDDEMIGKTPSAELPLHYVDSFGARHRFDVQKIPPVLTFGPERDP